jgi:peptidyl-prolyl cis-trans isomerase C
VSTQLAADSVIEQLEGGADFEELADEESVSDSDGEGGEIGWTARSVQEDDIQAAIEGLEAGEWSETIESGVFFDIYFLKETAEDREYEEALASTLTTERYDDWLVDATASVEVDDDLSTDEESWINERVLADVTSRLGG